jgi:hypothetical protein
VIHIDEQGRERRVPYNNEDGRIHHSTCPDVEAFKRSNAGAIARRLIDKAAKATPAPSRRDILYGDESLEDQGIKVTPPPAPKPAPSQGSLFGSTAPTSYGVD